MRLAIVLITFIAVAGNAASIDDVKSMLESRNDSCAQVAFKETQEMVSQAEKSYMTGNMQGVDQVMDNVYETYHRNEVHYFSLKGESERLRNILAKIKAKMLQIDNLDAKNSIEDLARTADIKLNMCDIEGANSIISDLESKLNF